MGEQSMGQADQQVAPQELALAPDLNQADLSLVAQGTRIATRRGEVPVQDLVAGDEIVSRDRGLTAVRWVGMLTAGTPSVKVPAGALGRNVPIRDCALSPNARIWMSAPEFETAFTAREVLVPAKDLIGWRGISEDKTGVPMTRYYLVLCDTPQVLTVNGMHIEMRHVGAAMEMFTTVQADEMSDLFPELLALQGKSDKWRRRLDKREASQVVDVKKRA
ncbi:Hint domain-containing protein [Shimia sp.]|uniref:Hint domain-containing protein n=1 Tax=Shimia sp. TaxID=1954381 RepID=UPI003B8E0701